MTYLLRPYTSHSADNWTLKELKELFPFIIRQSKDSDGDFILVHEIKIEAESDSKALEIAIDYDLGADFEVFDLVETYSEPDQPVKERLVAEDGRLIKA